MCTAVGHESVLYVSTMPSVGLMEREAMPVLKESEVMSRIAVPVVSEPVPAVVGTADDCDRQIRILVMINTGYQSLRTGDEWPQSLCDGLAFANGSVNEIHDVRIFVNGEPGYP